MNKPLLGEKLAVLVASGFNEKDLTFIQRAVQHLGVSIRIIGMDGGLVDSWKEDGWGLNFATDSVLNSALAVDYSMLFIPGGERSINKLKLTEHTRRFIGGFIDSGKPVVAISDAIDLLLFFEKLQGRSVAAAENLQEAVEEGGAVCVDDAYCIDHNLLSISSQEDVDGDYADVVTDFLISQYSIAEAA